MFFIYLGHYGVVTGNAYNWVFSFHVCLFFYLSGCLENFNHKTILENIQKKVINILIPFFFFAILGSKRKIASTLTFLGGCFAATNI